MARRYRVYKEDDSEEWLRGFNWFWKRTAVPNPDATPENPTGLHGGYGPGGLGRVFATLSAWWHTLLR